MNWGQIRKVTKNYSYMLTISDFDCPEAGADIDLPSCVFPFVLESSVTLQVSLKLMGSSCSSRKCTINITNYIGNFNFRVQCTLKCGRATVTKELSNSITSLDLCLNADNECLLQSGGYVITCEISYMKYVLVQNSTNVLLKESEFFHDFAHLFERKKFSDITFQVGDELFQAHKAVMACRSPVFSAMFEHQMTEALSNKVMIEDTKARVFEELLRFIYTDKVLNLTEVATELFIASDKYDLKRLRSMCENEMCTQISTDNVVDMLLFADLRKADTLKKLAKDFIVSNRTKVVATDGWQGILKNHSHLIDELFLEYAK